MLLLGSQLLFVPSAYPHLSFFHRVTTAVLCIIPYFFIYKAVTSTASYITSSNHWQKMHEYPYDHVLFQPGRFCQSCHFRKPARSKHCGICNMCIAKHDHHCIWVMNCVGRSNYAYFIGMLMSLSVLLSYGSYITYLLAVKRLQDHTLRRSEGMNRRKKWSTDLTWSRYFELWAWALTENIPVGGVGMLDTFTAPLAWVFFDMGWHDYKWKF